MSAHSSETFYRRFDAPDRVLHLFLMASFLGLALTGLPLLFSETKWASKLMDIGLGNFRIAGNLHRFFAAIMISVFITHLARLMYRLFVKKDYGILWGPGSMVPQPKDVFDMLGHMRWFLGLGQRPKFDRYTYWEKFDYWAVFWGMGIIGGSGFLLWFPGVFSKIIPGWVFNIGLLIHGEEALLAVVFIFTIHFFNGHLRPEKFPMDTVIFTGSLPSHELEDERPLEWERLNAEGRLKELEVPAPARQLWLAGRTVGTIAVTLGLFLVVLALYGLYLGE